MHNAFSSVSDYLWVSYPISDSEGSRKLVSQMITRLYDLFPKLNKPILLQEPEEVKDATRFITTPRKTRAPLTAQLSRYMNGYAVDDRSEEHTSELQSRGHLVCRLLLEKKKTKRPN